jgi:hypothetical protein
MLGGDHDACWCGTLTGVLDPVGSRSRGEDCAGHIPAADRAVVTATITSGFVEREAARDPQRCRSRTPGRDPGAADTRRGARRAPRAVTVPLRSVPRVQRGTTRPSVGCFARRRISSACASNFSTVVIERERERERGRRPCHSRRRRTRHRRGDRALLRIARPVTHRQTVTRADAYREGRPALKASRRRPASGRAPNCGEPRQQPAANVIASVLQR